ncbi:DUF2971 domain-containing protein [Leptospira dzoumogneensis]|uniref:DUF2971 domain-containing protein n=1 Tax=Leptospira dzoumogneensis TaxID=2484904 RepID=A0A4Z1AUK3_9LEPT|nr:DUF2971 domain-containing protein [Leptospira dzoumogneensis]TGN00006.1 DUF2971 domain-containing protein [Leptospira dzoumogneensis]
MELDLHKQLYRIIAHEDSFSLGTKYFEFINNKGYISKGKYYHYTTLDTFKLILKSESLLFSNISTMNDPYEFSYGLHLAKNVLKDVYKDTSIGTANRAIYKGLLDLIDMELVKVKKSFYTVSFSNMPDSLPQWIAYGDGGGGVSIGITPNTRSFINLDKLIFNKVIYNREIQSELIDYSLNFFEKYIRGFSLTSFFAELQADIYVSRKKLYTKYNFESFSKELLSKLSILLNYMKIDHYSHENEFRWLLKTEAIPKSYGLKSGFLSKDITGKRLPIKEIVLGPKIANSTLYWKEIERLLKKSGYSDVKIKFSKIPFR